MRAFLSPQTVVRPLAARRRARPGAEAPRPDTSDPGDRYATEEAATPGVALLRRPGPAPADDAAGTGPDRVELSAPLGSELFDELFAARLSPVDVEALADRFGLAGPQRRAFRHMFTEQSPRRYGPNLTGDVRMRHVGHASVLLDFGGFTVLTDPAVGYDGDGFAEHHTIADLPDVIDVVLLTNGDCLHFSPETLLQLRRRIGVVVVPRAFADGPAPGGLPDLLARYGFTDVVELGDGRSLEFGPARVRALSPPVGPGGPHRPAAMTPLVRLGGRGFVFAAHGCPVDPVAEASAPHGLGQVDALFTTAERADRLAGQLDAEQVFVRARGVEPWLTHLTGCRHGLEPGPPEPNRAGGRPTGNRGGPPEPLHLATERFWPVRDETN